MTLLYPFVQKIIGLMAIWGITRVLMGVLHVLRLFSALSIPYGSCGDVDRTGESGARQELVSGAWQQWMSGAQ